MRSLSFPFAALTLTACIAAPPSSFVAGRDAGGADDLAHVTDQGAPTFTDVGGDNAADGRITRDLAGPETSIDGSPDLPASAQIELRIPSGAVRADLLPFIVLVDGRHDLLQQFARSAEHVRFVASRDEPLDYEVEAFDPATGRLRAWVALPAVRARSDNDFFIEISDAPFPEYEPDRTWNDNWLGVWHMEDAAHVDGSQIRDSSPSANHGVAKLTDEPPVDGQIGQAISMDGVDSYVEITNHRSLRPTEEITLSAWVFPNRIDPGGIISMPAPTIGVSWNDSYQLWVNHFQQTAAVIAANDTVNEAAGEVLPTESWQFLVTTYDGSTMSVYRNGEFEGSRPLTGAIQYEEADVYIGADVNGGSFALWLDALIDEVRLAGRAANPDRIKAWYDNQVDPAAFVLWDP